MRTLDQWLQEYARDHQNPINKKIHHICVPTIMFSLLGLIWNIPFPQALSFIPFLNWSTLFIAFALFFYALLSWRAFIVMLFLSIPQIFLLSKLSGKTNLLSISLTLFVVAWIGQFIGHKIEGKKPSFFEDLQFLLIGPLWVFKRLLI